MTRPANSNAPQRACKFEQLEARLALSVQPVAAVEPVLAVELADMAEPVWAWSSGLQFGEVAAISRDYGFTGKGQTVAIIDTGIAWDHAALGSGYGTGHKVVGGWDFAENDNNPYDDGPFGFHGTHVAGIVGSTDATRFGVARGVDLVALRVFNDSGAGDFRWVEQALQWVHQNRNSFANPITTVNMSLGTRDNLSSLPGYAMLEDELATLRADGIFVSVAAGNSFGSYQTPGLSYPAVSPHVVPVSSHDANGELSSFSQRDQRVLVAPGRNITSTVPDYVFAGTQSNGFMQASGTSMAAPYVAGASALLREAMTFMGYDQINQQRLYDHFRATADQVWDQVTGSSYHRVNLRAAIDAVIVDDHADSAGQATSLGLLNDRLSFSGTVGRIGDVDQIAFTASASGTAVLQLQTTHRLAPTLYVNGVQQVVAGPQFQFAVQAGQRYVMSLSTGDGIGHFDGQLQLQRAINPMNWGNIGHRVIEQVSVQGEGYFSLTAGRAGILTLEGLGAQGITRFDLMNEQMQVLATATSYNGQIRLDRNADLGERFLLRITGQNENFSVRATNLVRLEQDRLSIFGTQRDDQLVVSMGSTVTVLVNGVSYRWTDTVNQINANAFGGQDQLHLSGSEGDDLFRIYVGRTHLVAGSQTFDGRGFEQVTAVGRSGNDMAMAWDSAGNDRLIDGAGWTRMVGTGFDHRMGDMEWTRVVSSQGNDIAFLNDTRGNDRLLASTDSVTFHAGQRTVNAERFGRVTVFASAGGNDEAVLNDSLGQDRVVFRPGYAQLNDSIRAIGFATVSATSNYGNDTVWFELTTGVDTLIRESGQLSRLQSPGCDYAAIGFSEVYSTWKPNPNAQAAPAAQALDVVAEGPVYTNTQTLVPQVSASRFWQPVGHSHSFSDVWTSHAASTFFGAGSRWSAETLDLTTRLTCYFSDDVSRPADEVHASSKISPVSGKAIDEPLDANEQNTITDWAFGFFRSARPAGFAGLEPAGTGDEWLAVDSCLRDWEMAE